MPVIHKERSVCDMHCSRNIHCRHQCRVGVLPRLPRTVPHHLLPDHFGCHQPPASHFKLLSPRKWSLVLLSVHSLQGDLRPLPAGVLHCRKRLDLFHLCPKLHRPHCCKLLPQGALPLRLLDYECGLHSPGTVPLHCLLYVFRLRLYRGPTRSLCVKRWRCD
ncbi:uncharacterized protein LOC144798597 isoform X1 [Lissotriton helveticus]